LLGPGVPHAQSQAVKIKTPQRVLFVEELSDLLTEHFPAFYRLGHAYFEGNTVRPSTCF